jgi:peroxiredoxin
MVELGQLEEHHQIFTERNVRIIAVSSDDLETTKEMQADFPHLVMVSDPDQNVAKAVDVLHRGMKKDGRDTNAPTTFLVDGDGYVQRVYRPERFMTRLTAEQLRALIDEIWKQ